MVLHAVIISVAMCMHFVEKVYRVLLGHSEMIGMLADGSKRHQELIDEMLKAHMGHAAATGQIIDILKRPNDSQ